MRWRSGKRAVVVRVVRPVMVRVMMKRVLNLMSGQLTGARMVMKTRNHTIHYSTTHFTCIRPVEASNGDYHSWGCDDECEPSTEQRTRAVERWTTRPDDGMNRMAVPGLALPAVTWTWGRRRGTHASHSGGADDFASYGGGMPSKTYPALYWSDSDC